VPKNNEVEVLDADFVLSDVGEPLDAPTAPALLNTCFGCKESFSVPLIMVMNQPCCGGCLLKGGAYAARAGKAVLRSIFGRQRRKRKTNV